MALLFRSPFGDRRGAFLVHLESVPERDERFARAAEACRLQVEQQASDEVPEARPAGWAARQTRDSALEALENPDLQRQALLFLARNAQAALVQDLA